MATTTPLTTIWNQISSSTKMACGARQPVAAEDGSYLHFEVGAGRNFDKITVTLDPSDTYTVELVRINRRTYEVKTLASQDIVYAENLSDVIYSMVNK